MTVSAFFRLNTKINSRNNLYSDAKSQGLFTHIVLHLATLRQSTGEMSLTLETLIPEGPHSCLNFKVLMLRCTDILHLGHCFNPVCKDFIHIIHTDNVQKRKHLFLHFNLHMQEVMCQEFLPPFLSRWGVHSVVY